MCSFSVVQLFVTSWTVACQASLSIGLSREEYCSGLPFPSPGDLPNPWIKPMFVSCIGRQILYHWATREACFTSKLLESKQTLLRSWDVSFKCKNDGVSLPPQTFKTTQVQNKIHTSFTTVSEALSCSQSVMDSQAETRKVVHCWVILQLLCI